MFKTLKNAWRIPELKKKLLFTLLIIVLYRLGANIPVPYISSDVFSGVSDAFAKAGGAGSILTFLNILSGDALSKATLFALGVSPYITASIVMQLLTIAIPKFQEWSKDQSGSGKKKLTLITRITTIVLAVVTSIGYVFFLDSNSMLASDITLNFWRGAVIVACYCAGASLVMWLAERINEKGIGNGISMILFANILSGMFAILSGLWTTIFPATGFSWKGLLIALVQVIIILAIITIIVWMSDAERRIPIQYAKRVVGRKMYGGQNTNLPIKVNMSGVMPIIFANSIVALPATIAAFLSSGNGFRKFVESWFNYNKPIYIIVFLGLLIFFAYFYVSISFDPIEVSNNIKNNGGAIPGIRSGNPTAMYIKKILNRVTLVGAIIVAIIAVVPMVIHMVDGMINNGSQTFIAIAFSGSSFMIVVGVALETFRELEAQMSIRNYKGFLD